MIKVALIGTGNIASFLFDQFRGQNTIEIVAVAGRNISALNSFLEKGAAISDLKNIPAADIYILAIKDDAIAGVVNSLNINSGLVVHTAGSVDMNVLPKSLRRGVFYPLQTISSELHRERSNIPMCLEAETEKDYKLLETLAKCISDNIHRISSENRLQLHLAAIFANNFTNHMYLLASKMCADKKLPFELLHPLIQETSKKIKSLSPLEAQTGPARRRDKETQLAHLELLKEPRLKEVYKVLSESIELTYGEKL